MENTTKNIKVSEKHHKMLKEYCDKKGLKIYKIVQKWIDETCKEDKSTEIPKKKDIYGD
jgi:coproporphyrinogen III oxidase